MRIFLTVAFALAFICFFAEHGYCKIEDTDFVGMWLFDNEDGTDSSINGNHGQFNGDPDWGDGKFGSALLLNGSNYMQIPNTDSTEITEGPLSVVCWFNGNTLEKSMVTRGTSRSTAPNRDWDVFLVATNVVNWVGSSGADYIWLNREGTSEIKAGTWYHMAAVWDGTSGKDSTITYINGEVDGVADATGDELSASHTINIGGSGTYSFDGLLDEVGILRKALTKAEVQNIMKSGLEFALAVSAPGKLISTWAKCKARY